MENTKFYARFRLNPEGKLVLEYDSGKNLVVLTIEGLKRIGGNNAEIFMGDTPEGSAASLVTAGRDLKPVFDYSNGFAYFECRDIVVDIGEPCFINMYGAIATSAFLYLVADSVTKEVIPNER